MDFFGRLREERARLGLTQQEVADTANVHVKTVRRWESQVAIPLDAMVPLLGIGYDVQYVASGLRSKNVHELREKGIDYEVAPGSTRDEVEMLKAYRALTPAQRDQARAMLSVLAVKSSGERSPRSAAAAGKAERGEAPAAKGRPRRGKG
ncbi:helix-turn-helix protein [Tahibacter aquaticus]|uniref:Helix-turn-helix protein n=1 Tax=Tahibacter aquaticus TaxID=520092 RepID=A0A4R6YVS6_9GAMM|nr:helix-turn-helix domain-containing protein [Tahibacter aquaticus]TDR42579.1 helix-turn-helix protein [Tahibacter aquaticus]